MKRTILVYIVAILACVSLSSQSVFAAEWNNIKNMVITEQIPLSSLHTARSSNELPAIPLPGQQNKLRGDADGNGNVNYVDALLVLRHSIGLENLDDTTVTLCDVDNSGDLSYEDALMILRYSIGLITDLR